VDGAARIEELTGALAARDAALAARDAALAARDAALAVGEARIAELERLVAELRNQLSALVKADGQDSSNSNQPPSSDAPGRGVSQRRKNKRDKKKRRGGQKGHRGSHRGLLPPEEVDELVHLYPGECENCWEKLPEVSDPAARRYQYTELCPLARHVTEFVRHAVACPDCGYKTRAAYDPAVIPRFAFGPRLMSVVALLTGVYHLSRRKTAQLMWELLGVRISTGSISNIEHRVSEAVEPAVNEAWDRAMAAPVKHTDGTSWLQSGVMKSLWTVATTAVTVFRIVANGRMDTLRSEVLSKIRGTLVSDRATALTFWAMENRQICWAHLLRKFVSFSQHAGKEGTIGRELLGYMGIMFAYWTDYKAGKLSRELFVMWMAPVREQVEAALERAVAADIKGFSGSCKDMLAHRAALWTFVERDDVEPTNNHAERELRGFVLWRKASFGTQSDRGNRFAERLMTIAHTARKQHGQGVLDFLVACCSPRKTGQPAPSLFATT